MATTKSSSELLSVIQSLTEEVQVLRQAVDELREEVQWANHNSPSEFGFSPGRRMESCSLDPVSANVAASSLDGESPVRKETVAASPLQHTQSKLFT